MAIGTNSKYPRLGIRSEVRSTYIDDVVGNVKNDLNTLESQISAASIGTTNAETTAARPYQSSLNDRLDIINSYLPSFIEGFAVSAQGSPNMTVQVAAGQGTIAGVEVEKTSTTNTATITAPTTNNRYDVVYVQSDNTIAVATGSESADPVYPNLATTRKALAVIALTPATTQITSSEITDCRSWGAYYLKEGAYKYEWKAQDAIDDLDNNIGGEIKIVGDIYENLDISGKNNVVLQGYECNLYRISDTNSCIKSVNTITNETTGNKILGFSAFGNSKAGSLPLYEFDYTDEFVIRDCVGDGNSSSSATGKDIEVNNCDGFNIESTNLASYDYSGSNTNGNITGDDVIYVVSAGSFPIASQKALTNTTSGTYQERDYFISNFTGTISTTFDIYVSSTGTAFGRIYVNGIAVGTERSTGSTTPVTYTEDISIDVGDRVSIYIKASSATTNLGYFICSVDRRLPSADTLTYQGY